MDVGKICKIIALLAFGILCLVVQTLSTENCSFEKCVTGKEFCNTLQYKNHCEKCDLIPDYCQYPEKKEQCELISCKNQEIERFKEKMKNKSEETDFLKAQVKNKSKIIEENQTELRLQKLKLNETLDKISDLENSIKTIKNTCDEQLHGQEEELESEKARIKNNSKIIEDNRRELRLQKLKLNETLDKNSIYFIVILVLIALLLVACCIIGCLVWKYRNLKFENCKSFEKKFLLESQRASEDEIMPPKKCILEHDMEIYNRQENEKYHCAGEEIIHNFIGMENEKQTTVKQPLTSPSHPVPPFNASTPIQPSAPQPSTLPSHPAPLFDVPAPIQPSAPQPPAAAVDVEPRHIPIATPQPWHQNVIKCHTYNDNSRKTKFYKSAIGTNCPESSVGSVTSPVSHQPSNISNRDSTETTCTPQEQEQQLNVSQDEARMPLTREEYRQPIQVSEENHH